MNNVKAIFKKQAKGILRNPESLIQFLIFPLVAFAMTAILNFDEYYFTEEMLASMPNMVTMMATAFAGMALIPMVASIIAEDIEKKSLRFLRMAGMKPAPYLLGVGGVVLVVSMVTSVIFGFISDFSGADFWIFAGGIMSGVAASIVLGATIGILSKGQQSSTALSMPIAMVLGFGPMMAQFNDTVARILHPFYTQQLNVVADYLAGNSTAPLWNSFAIMWGNVIVLGIIFALVYAKKGLKG
ncbi:MAG: ABC transporter permease [Defluviitaleaceae bacterium]|nr:ABC transporter permease [Defluviitaleaceae bacterium]